MLVLHLVAIHPAGNSRGIQHRPTKRTHRRGKIPRPVQALAALPTSLEAPRHPMLRNPCEDSKGKLSRRPSISALLASSHADEVYACQEAGPHPRYSACDQCIEAVLWPRDAFAGFCPGFEASDGETILGHTKAFFKHRPCRRVASFSMWPPDLQQK